MKNKSDESPKSTEDRPPILKSWNRLYLIVLLNLAAIVVLFYLFTLAFK